MVFSEKSNNQEKMIIILYIIFILILANLQIYAEQYLELLSFQTFDFFKI